ncbi:hypothetical protein ACOSOMT5_P3059 [Acidiphilium sp. MT5]
MWRDKQVRFSGCSSRGTREAAIRRTRATVTAEGSPLAASMLRDIQRSGRIEADHILGALIARSPAHEVVPVLRTAAASGTLPAETRITLMAQGDTLSLRAALELQLGQ